MSVWTKFENCMMLSEDDEEVTTLAREIAEKEHEKKEHEEKEHEKSLITKMFERIQESIDKKFGEMFNEFFEKTEGFWEMLGKGIEKMCEIFDKLHEKVGTVPILVLGGISAISLYVLIVILSFNL